MITDLAQFLKFLYSDDGPLTKLARKSPGEPFTVGEEAMVRAVIAGICGLELFHAIEKAYASDDDDAPTAILDVVRNRLGLPPLVAMRAFLDILALMEVGHNVGERLPTGESELIFDFPPHLAERLGVNRD